MQFELELMKVHLKSYCGSSFGSNSEFASLYSYSETEPSFKHVFHTGGLMRSKLTPDNCRLIISLSRGYIIVIHDLDLFTLSSDLHGFKPNMYRLIQLSTEMPIRMEHLEHYNHHFQRSRNRVEFISDFPKDVDAEVISSLQASNMLNKKARLRVISLSLA